MSSEVYVANTALYKVGADTIVSLGDDSNGARVCNHFYATLRDAVLRAYPWNFATAYLDFGAPLSAAPAFTYANAFSLPASPFVLRVLEPSDRSIEFKVVGRQLYTDESTIACKCIFREVSPSEFDALFIQALAARLAAEIAWPLTKNSGTQKAMWELYQAILLEAEEIDSQEGTADDLDTTALSDVRHG